MDDNESVLDMVELLHRRTMLMNDLYIRNRNAFDPDGSTDSLRRHVEILEQLITSTKNMISGLNGIPVIGEKAKLRYRA